jgi:hypothetical protein
MSEKRWFWPEKPQGNSGLKMDERAKYQKRLLLSVVRYPRWFLSGRAAWPLLHAEKNRLIKNWLESWLRYS